MKFIKDENGIIYIYRNKRKPLKAIEERASVETGCLHCSLFDCCSKYGRYSISICNTLEDLGLVDPDNDFSDRYFINAKIYTKVRWTTDGTKK